MRIKRIDIEVHEDLLEEAIRATGARTYSAAVNSALAEVLRIQKVSSLRSFFNKGLWRGALVEMRADERILQTRTSGNARRKNSDRGSKNRVASKRPTKPTSERITDI